MKLHLNTCLWSAVATVAMAAGANAQSVFTDNFDTYVLGSAIHGQNGWHEWDGVQHPGVSFIVDNSTGKARTGQALSIDATSVNYGNTSDMVHEFSGVTSGQHTMRAYTYGETGVTTKWFFIGLNTYSTTGPWDWSIQITFDPVAGTWSCDAGFTTPSQGVLLMDTWVEVRAQIDLTANLCEMFYNGASCAAPYSWTGGVFGGGTGALNVACVDLYHSPGTGVGTHRAYYDDFGVTDGFPPPSPTTYCTAKVNSQGCTPVIGFTGFSSAAALSGFSVTGSNVLKNKNGLAIYNSGAAPAGTVFQGGYLCITPPIKRSTALNSGSFGPNICDGKYSIDMNTFAHSAGSPLPAAFLLTPGTQVNVQIWGRDPGFPFPNNSTLTGGLSYTVGT